MSFSLSILSFRYIVFHVYFMLDILLDFSSKCDHENCASSHWCEVRLFRRCSSSGSVTTTAQVRLCNIPVGSACGGKLLALMKEGVLASPQQLDVRLRLKSEKKISSFIFFFTYCWSSKIIIKKKNRSASAFFLPH